MTDCKVLLTSVLNIARCGTISLMAALAIVACSRPGEPLPGTQATAPEPTRLEAIPLREAIAGADPEIEEMQGDRRALRNVVNPTLTPILPDQSNTTGAAVIIAPGGAFLSLAIDAEGYQVAQWLARRGVAAFVLKYRLRTTPGIQEGFQQQAYETLREVMEDNRGIDAYREPMMPTAEALEDSAAAVRLVRQRAQEWGIDPARVGMMGFSAGAMATLAAGLSDDEPSRPDFIAPIYPPMMPRPVPTYAPPMFVVISLDDNLFALNKSLGLIDAWRKADRPVEAHLYERGGHGFGMDGNSKASALWAEEFYAWLQDRRIILDPAGASGWSVQISTIGELLDDPQARAILDRYIPQLTGSSGARLMMMRPATLAVIRSYAPDMLTEEKMRAIQAELDAL